MELHCDLSIISKNGVLLFTQRHLNDCYIKTQIVSNQINISIVPKDTSMKLLVDDLYNELLECEFIAQRYIETEELRKAVLDKILTTNSSQGSEK